LRLKLSLPLLLALAFGGVHLIFALSHLVPNGTSGESAALGFLLYDYPLHWLVGHFDWGTSFRFDSGRHYVVFFSIVGTLMHGVFGFLLGFVVVSLFGAFHSKRW
jgi:hypothetical protein